MLRRNDSQVPVLNPLCPIAIRDTIVKSKIYASQNGPSNPQIGLLLKNLYHEVGHPIHGLDYHINLCITKRGIQSTDWPIIHTCCSGPKVRIPKR